MDKHRKFFIDTDAGTDDAIALMMAFAAADARVMGISTVAGNVSLDRVVQNVLFLRELCVYDCPVFIGAGTPLSRTLDVADFIHGKDGLGDIGLQAYGRSADEGDAVEQLAQMVNQFPHEIELILLGPLTNLAHFCLLHRGLIPLVKHVYIMGGLVELPGNITPFAEYNIWADPEAADIVLCSALAKTMIGWDVTCQAAGLTLQEVENMRNLGTFKAQLAADIQQTRIKWSLANEPSTVVTLADPIAMAIAIDHNIAIHSRYYSARVIGGDDRSPHRGFVELQESEQGKNLKIVTTADAFKFRSLLTSSLLA